MASFAEFVIFQRGGAQVMKFRPHIFKIGVVVAPQHFHAVHTNGGPALMVGAFAVTGGKILDVAPECRAQVVILQFVPDSTPSGYSTVDIGVVSFLLIPTAFGDTPGSIR